VRESGGSKKCPNGHILAGVEQMPNNKLENGRMGKGRGIQHIQCHNTYVHYS
jgi:hypothetical protein